MLKRIAIAALALSLASCGAPRHRPPAPPALPATAGSMSLAPPGSYAIDSNRSELRILVYRAGPLSKLGHNHVVVSRALTGVVQLGNSLAESSFSLRVPVESFVVDESEARRQEGADFPGDLSSDAKLGTRRNMLGAGLLDAARYPTISVTGMTVSGTTEAPVAELSIEVAGHESKVSAPFHIEGDAHRLMATGSVQLRQSDLGLTPSSLMYGALQVQDAVQLKFSLAVPIS